MDFFRKSVGRSYSKGKEKAEKRTRVRKVKDKKRPKRALGPYMYFCKDQRKDIQEQNPSMSFGDIGRVLGSQWSKLNDKDKQVGLLILVIGELHLYVLTGHVGEIHHTTRLIS